MATQEEILEVGDKVIIIRSSHEDCISEELYQAGDYGVIVGIDEDDSDLPYLIRFKRVLDTKGCGHEDLDKHKKNHWWVDNYYTELMKVPKRTTWEQVRVLADIVKGNE